MAVVAADLQSAAQTEPQRAAAALMTGLCGSLQGDPGVQGELGEAVCNMEDSSVSEAQVRPALGAVAWEEVATQGTFSAEASSRQLANLGARLRALRLGATGGEGPALIAYRPVPSGGSLLLASTDGGGGSMGPVRLDPRLGVFASAALSIGEKDATATEDGFDFDTVGFTAGMDYRFTDRFILGLAVGSSSVDAELDDSEGDVGADSYSLSLYSTYYVNDFFLDLTTTAGMADYDMSRNIRYTLETDSVDKTAVSTTDGHHYALALNAGYEFRGGGTLMAPYAGVDYLHTEIDDFRERGADWFNLQIGDQEVTSLQSVLGLQASYPVRAGDTTLLPRIRAEWRHEFDNDARALEARLVNDPSDDIEVVVSDDPDRDYFTVSTGLTGALPGGSTASLEYQTVLGLDDVSHHILQARLRMSF
ncbi:autotransporter outer membrane beta-barrel domain-containing protein [Halomonas cerina]|uniref:Outer membrane autotransporter protein n=1 Tax=Halomonas cerina TaxID=447424 RepID=A0A839VA01_9GAMM|nr:autotransporter outer membrane beta-barrel domain-containing protein [Halomonas cerina]MBB3189547.1 outer membrane autotransporter protein [Halomonas cerina]